MSREAFTSTTASPIEAHTIVEPKPSSPLSNLASIPAEHCYWAILEASGWKRSGQLPPGLLADLADQVPIELGDLHVVGTPVTGGRVLVCAATNELLATLVAQHPTAPLLAPDRVPSELDADSIHPRTLNLLVGPFEPAASRAARQRLHLSCLAAAVALLILLTIGLTRRAEHARATLAQARTQIVSHLNAHGYREDQLLKLTTELDTLRRIAGVDLTSRRSPDAAASLAAVLAGWPTPTPTPTPTSAAVEARPQSLTIGPEGAAIGVLIPGDPAPFLAAMHPPEGWTLEQPQLTRIGDQTRINLLLHPAPAATPTKEGQR